MNTQPMPVALPQLPLPVPMQTAHRIATLRDLAQTCILAAYAHPGDRKTALIDVGKQLTAMAESEASR